MGGDGAPAPRAWVLAERLERFMTTDLAAAVEVLRRIDPVIPCGASDPDPNVERRVASARSELGFAPDGDGCGRLIVLWSAYRCVECSRWFHRACIEQHFRRHRTPQAD